MQQGEQLDDIDRFEKLDFQFGLCGDGGHLILMLVNNESY